ncbi:hypothetical protein IU460_29260 [Nocardia farcinica]|nr:hypothetical protein [Nocardia farcinica]
MTSSIIFREGAPSRDPQVLIIALTESERVYAEVDFNVRPDHSYPTLTDRQESLAQHLKCAVKTVRRRSDQALDTLAYLLVRAMIRTCGSREGAPSRKMIDEVTGF